MFRHWSLPILLAAASCSGASPPCTRTVSDASGSFDGYDVVAGTYGAIVVVGRGELPWRVLYAEPRSCGASGGGAGNPMLLELLRSDSVEWIEADGCGDEDVMVTSEAAAAEVARRVGNLLASRHLGERVTIRVRCATPSATAR